LERGERVCLERWIDQLLLLTAHERLRHHQISIEEPPGIVRVSIDPRTLLADILFFQFV
jgi:hypothetical protein